MAAQLVMGGWRSRCWGPGAPSVLPVGTSWTPTFSVATSTVGLLSPFLEEGTLGEARAPPGESHSTVMGLKATWDSAQ